MTTICGRYVDTFAEATHGMLEGASLDAPYKFHSVKVLRVEGAELVCTGAGEEMRLPVRRRGKREFSEVTVRDPIFGPLKFKVAPFKDEKGR
ncbi:hypothetical protein [Methylobacterium aquaticum]|uniref:Uncharacterized protein n=1 Tax=Methylobacterium aquaticum TaxID=270351 RepID=A0A0C6FXQ9_9HYPH|nr:hypothetical protein [Methylobacterium aquaticum]BAQ50374.1 hypothetical protein Maq22A_4p60085 [Methylobacterium aquaticum]